jgi:aminoglycoside phosphotransferase (APT) family kinase protein
MPDTLHRVRPKALPGTPTCAESRTFEQERDELMTSAEQLSELLVPDLLDHAKPYLAGVIPAPQRDAQHRFIHGDLKPEHCTVNPVSGTLTGVIDLTDAMVADPLIGFVGLIDFGRRTFLDLVLARYALPLGRGFDGSRALTRGSGPAYLHREISTRADAVLAIREESGSARSGLCSRFPRICDLLASAGCAPHADAACP